MPPMSFQGVVTRAGLMDKTVTVTVTRTVNHPRTGKLMQRHTNIQTHDEKNELRKEDVVVIRHCRKLSATKSHKLETIIRSPEMERELKRKAAEANRIAEEAPVPTPSPILEALKARS